MILAGGALDCNQCRRLLHPRSRRPSCSRAEKRDEIPSSHFAPGVENGTQMTFVPYRGAAPAMQDLLAGQIDLLFSGPEQLPLMRAGSVKAYAVSSDVRLASAPDIPTFREMGLPALPYTTWAGFFARRAQ
jgi:tripartite-type tricarboxylate transporter receptor subunit TctC